MLGLYRSLIAEDMTPPKATFYTDWLSVYLVRGMECEALVEGMAWVVC